MGNEKSWAFLSPATISCTWICAMKRGGTALLPSAFFPFIQYSGVSPSFVIPSLCCVFDSKVAYPRGRWGFAFWQRECVFFPLLFFPKTMPSSLPHWEWAVLVFSPCSRKSGQAMENFVLISMGTAASYKTAVIHLHVRAALDFKNSFSTPFCPAVPLGKRSRWSAQPTLCFNH